MSALLLGECSHLDLLPLDPLCERLFLHFISVAHQWRRWQDFRGCPVAAWHVRVRVRSCNRCCCARRPRFTDDGWCTYCLQLHREDTWMLANGCWNEAQTGTTPPKWYACLLAVCVLFANVFCSAVVAHLLSNALYCQYRFIATSFKIDCKIKR